VSSGHDAIQYPQESAAVFEVQVFPVCLCNKWAGNMLMFRLDVTTKQLMTHLKNDSFN